MFRQRQHKQGRQITGIRATSKQTRHVYVHVGVRVRVCSYESNSGDFISAEDIASCLGTAESRLDTQLVNGAGVRHTQQHGPTCQVAFTCKAFAQHNVARETRR